MSNKVLMVVAYDEPEDFGPETFHEMLERVRSLFEDKPGVQVHVAIRESAEKVLAVFQETRMDL